MLLHGQNYDPLLAMNLITFTSACLKICTKFGCYLLTPRNAIKNIFSFKNTEDI